MSYGKIIFFALCSLVGFGAAKYLTQDSSQPAHYHIDFKVYIGGEPVDLSSDKYQSHEGDHKNPHIHLHDGIGSVVHFHRSGLTLDDLFNSLGGSLSANCVEIGGKHHCTGIRNSLRVYVNGNRILLPHTYVPKDLDKILVSYSPHFSDVSGQINSLTTDACLYSLKCPEKGEPPTESCSSNPSDPCVIPGTDAH